MARILLACRLKRAGLDYWPFVVVKTHDSWQVSLQLPVLQHILVTALAVWLSQGSLPFCLKAVWQTNIPKPFQDFYSYFNEQSDPKRLFGFSKRGTKHYATPGAGQA